MLSAAAPPDPELMICIEQPEGEVVLLDKFNAPDIMEVVADSTAVSMSARILSTPLPRLSPRPSFLEKSRLSWTLSPFYLQSIKSFPHRSGFDA